MQLLYIRVYRMRISSDKKNPGFMDGYGLIRNVQVRVDSKVRSGWACFSLCVVSLTLTLRLYRLLVLLSSHKEGHNGLPVGILRYNRCHLECNARNPLRILQSSPFYSKRLLFRRRSCCKTRLRCTRFLHSYTKVIPMLVPKVSCIYYYRHSDRPSPHSSSNWFLTYLSQVA